MLRALGLQFVKAQKRADGNGHTQIPAPKTARHTLRSLRALRELTRAEFAALPKVTPLTEEEKAAKAAKNALGFMTHLSTPKEAEAGSKSLAGDEDPPDVPYSG